MDDFYKDKPAGYQHWPCWYYGPDNQSGIFHNALEVPEGWHDSPDKVDDPDAVTVIPGLDEAVAAAEGSSEEKAFEAYNDITVAELKEFLDGKGIEYDEADKKAELYELYEATFKPAEE